MTSEQQHDQQGDQHETIAGDPSEQLVLHLLRHPCDLVDTRRLMRRFHASADDVRRAIGRLERLVPAQAE